MSYSLVTVKMTEVYNGRQLSQLISDVRELPLYGDYFREIWKLGKTPTEDIRLVVVRPNGCYDIHPNTPKTIKTYFEKLNKKWEV